jgi:glycosyltransferase involved in cell wall biosynthesis
MRVILAHNHFKLSGGAEVFYHEVGRVLKENNHEVAFFSPQDDGVDSEWSEYFPKVVAYKKNNFIQGITNIKNLIYSKETKLKFEELVNDFKPDIVHVFSIQIRLTPSFLSICNDRQIPLIMSCNDYKHICPNYKLFQNNTLCEACKGGKFYNATLKKCSKGSLKYSLASSIEAYSHDFLGVYKNVDLFLFASNFMAKKTEEFWINKPFKWDILKNPFNSEKFIADETYENYILYFGRLIDEKGVDVLIKAMQHCPDVELKIIGTGPQEEELKKLATSLGLKNVSFLGPKWGDELNFYLKKCLCVVVPSLWHENFPYVILQSFAFSKAVIGTDRGGIPELIQNEKFGFIYPAKNDEKLAEYIRFAKNNKKKIIDMGKEAKLFADKNFNDKKFYENIKRIYDSLV